MAYWQQQAANGMTLDQMQTQFQQAAQDPLQQAKAASMVQSGAVQSFGDNPPTPPAKPLELTNFDFSQYKNPLDAQYAFLSKTLNPTIAAAAMGNFNTESYNNATTMQNQKLDSSGNVVGNPIFDANNLPTGYGLAQWGNVRLTNNLNDPKRMGLFDWAQKTGFDPNSTEGQSRFMVYELTNNPTYQKTYNQMLSAGNNLDKVTQILGKGYEGPESLSDTLGDRQVSAQMYYDYYNNPSALTDADRAEILQNQARMQTSDPMFQKYAADKAAAAAIAQQQQQQPTDTGFPLVADTTVAPVDNTVNNNIMAGVNDWQAQQIQNSLNYTDPNMFSTSMDNYLQNLTPSGGIPAGTPGAENNPGFSIQQMDTLPDWYMPEARGGAIHHALRLAHHYAVGGSEPSQPDRERLVDRLNRMLSQPSTSAESQDLTARRNEYLQDRPGLQIRGREFARGGYATQGSVDASDDSLLMQERQTITPSSLAKAWTPPEEAISENVGPRADEFMQQYPEKLGAAMAAAPEAIAHHVINTVMYPGQVLYGERPYDRDEAIKWANDASGMIMTGGLGTAALTPSATKNMSSTTRIFAGPMAETADLAALDTAKKMAETGAKREDIIDKTGWFQGADKKWRFEIPDNTSYADVESLAGEGIKLGSKLPLNNVFSHNPLYKAYPETATTDVRLMRSTDPFAVSSGEKYPLFVSLPEGSSDKLARAKLIHEAQHLVQRQEGFAEGANPKMFQHDEVSGLTPYEQYRNSIGEVEARNVERRRYMTPEERQRVYPWVTEDVPVEQQIIHSSSMPKTEPQMSVGPSSIETAQEMANKAVQTYGTTHNIAEAGYVLPNGKMLDFSGRHQAGYNRVGDKFTPKQGERDWLANDRAVDHRDVVHMLAGPEGMEGHEGMAKFMAEAGAIRNKPGIGFETAAIPTDKQIKTIVTSHNTKYRGEPMLVELSHPTTGDIIASRDFERPNVEAIQKWFGEQSEANPGIQLAPKFSRGGKAPRAFSSIPFGPEAAQDAVRIAKQQAGRR